MKKAIVVGIALLILLISIAGTLAEDGCELFVITGPWWEEHKHLVNDNLQLTVVNDCQDALDITEVAIRNWAGETTKLIVPRMVHHDDSAGVWIVWYQLVPPGMDPTYVVGGGVVIAIDQNSGGVIGMWGEE